MAKLSITARKRRIAAFVDWLESLDSTVPFYMRPGFARFHDLGEAGLRAAQREFAARVRDREQAIEIANALLPEPPAGSRMAHQRQRKDRR